ncbi:MAG TPA: prepilin-type N-terminal cleavage/methylation domain-containing protein [Candidatus Bathyarchaeia archaeon]|nr:prepilin-type N-terminal cleavage/methylation domain-containing protein [Candidatus Bathyarchaeia archaeon]
MKNLKFGFTLIELLIVIAILGILAIGLMAALDPLEQLKRGRDTSTRNSVEEFYNAALRYYSIKEEFPWGASSEIALALSAATGTYIQSLIDAGELKPRFADDVNKLGRIFLTSTHADFLGMRDDISVCFVPESKATRADANTKFNNLGITADNCPTTDFTSNTCYWCVR